MKEFFDCVFSANGMAYGTGVLIFLITLFLASKRVIGPMLTFLFLIFALIASLGVANQDLIRNYFAKGTTKETTFTDQLQKAVDDLKEEFEVYKKKLQDYLEQQNASTEKPADKK